MRAEYYSSGDDLKMHAMELEMMCQVMNIHADRSGNRREPSLQVQVLLAKL